MTSRLRAYSGGSSGTSLSLIHPEAIYDINFASGQWFGALPSDLVVSRASEALTLTAGGTYANFANNTARITANGLLIEEARTNSIRNPRGSGAVPGTPGTVPTNWLLSGLAGMSSQISTGVEDGLPYIDLRVFGTANVTAGGVPIIQPNSYTEIAALSGQTWTFSLSCFLKAGTAPTNLGFDVIEINSGGTPIASSVDVSIGSAASVGQAFKSTTVTLGNASTAFVSGRIIADFTNGASYDFTIRLAAPMLRQASFAGSPILNAAGVTSSATTQPADVVYLPISGVGTEHTIFVETSGLTSNSNEGTMAETWFDINNRNRIVTQTSGVYGTAVDAGITNATAPLSSASSGLRKMAFRVKSNDLIVCSNGTLGTVAVLSATSSVPSRLYMGCRNGTAGFLNGNLRRIAIIPRALSDAELQTLTT